MRRRRKSDWFSIVATDLFCGALCAVIILDAVSKRAPSMIEGPGGVVVSFPIPTGGCQSVLAVGILDTAAGELLISTRGAQAASGRCTKTTDITDRTGAKVRRWLLAKGNGNFWIDVAIGTAVPMNCHTGASAC